MIQDKIISFLTNREWVAIEGNAKLTTFRPPADFNLPEGFTISIPTSTEFSDFNQFIDNTLEIIGSLYEYSIDELKLMLDKEQTIFSIRIYDDKTKDGRISLIRFEQVLERVKGILLDTASFVIDKNALSFRVPPEAQRYLNLCEFIETQKGSFIAKIQLPQKELIKENELFDRNEIYSEEINEKVKDVLTYVNNEVFTSANKINVTDDYIIENEDHINLKLLKNIESFYLNADIKNIDFTFSSIDETEKIESQNITKAKIHHLTELIEDVSNKTIEIADIAFRGQIITLKSKDPDGSRNNVTLGGVYNELPVIASVKLDSEHYKEAIEAHKLKQYINITGTAKKTKTRVSFINVATFQIEE